MTIRRAIVAAVAGAFLLAGCATESGSDSAGNQGNAEQALIEQGIAAYKAGDLAGAEASWAQVLQTQPNNPYAHLNLGVVKAVTNRKQEALAHYQTAAQYGGDAPIVQTINQSGGVAGSSSTTVAAVATDNASRL